MEKREIKIFSRLVHKINRWEGVAISNSMEPLIYPGEKVVFENPRKTIIKKLDIIAVKRKNRPIVVHRVVSIKETAGRRIFITRGDNLAKDDEPVSEKMVIGRVVVIKNRFARIPFNRFVAVSSYYCPHFLSGRKFFKRLLFSRKLYRLRRQVKKIWGKIRNI